MLAQLLSNWSVNTPLSQSILMLSSVPTNQIPPSLSLVGFSMYEKEKLTVDTLSRIDSGSLMKLSPSLLMVIGRSFNASSIEKSSFLMPESDWAAAWTSVFTFSLIFTVVKAEFTNELPPEDSVCSGWAEEGSFSATSLVSSDGVCTSPSSLDNDRSDAMLV